MTVSVAELPQFVIDDIVQYATPCHEYDTTVYESGLSAAAKRLKWVCVGLALVAPRWAAAIQRSETVPPLLAEACALRLPRSIRHGGFMTMHELRHRVGARGELKPLPAGLLLPIEDCARADCPRYCDALASAELMEPLARLGSEQLRRRRQFYCARCDKVVPIRASRRQDAEHDHPHAIVQTRVREQFLRRPRNRPTYGIAVIDCDGVSSAAMLRVIRAMMFDGSLVFPDTAGGNRWEYPDASSACFTPSFRLTAGSCAHQYEFYPVTVDAAEGHRCAIPEDHPARTRHPTMQLLFYGVVVSLTPRLVAADATKRMTEAAQRDLVSQAWRRPVLQMIAPVAADNDKDTAEIPPVGADCRPLPVDGNGALRILRVIESGCGSETDSDSDGATSADTPGGRSRSPLSTDGGDCDDNSTASASPSSS